MNLRTKFIFTTFVLVLVLFIIISVVAILLHSQDSCKFQHPEKESTRPKKETLATNHKTDISITTQEIETVETSERQLSVTTVNGQHVKPGVLVYNEEFNVFDTTAWEHMTNADSDFYYYVNERTNSFVRDGKLFIQPTFTSDKFGEDYLYNGTLLSGKTPSEKCLNQSALCWKRESSPEGINQPIMSAMLDSEESFKFQYGRLVIRAKMPGGDWIEPILSLQPAGHKYGEGVVSGLIYLTDTSGNRKLFNSDVNVGAERTCPDIRFGTHEDKKIIFYCLSTKEDEGFDRGFHDYEVLWTPDSITIKIDGEGLLMAPNPRPSFYKLWSKGRDIKNPWNDSSNKVMAPFDTEFYLYFGLRAGGTSGFFPDDLVGPYPKPWENDDPDAAKTFWEDRESWSPSWAGDNAAMQIESIKLWSLNTTTSD